MMDKERVAALCMIVLCVLIAAGGIFGAFKVGNLQLSFMLGIGGPILAFVIWYGYGRWGIPRRKPRLNIFLIRLKRTVRYSLLYLIPLWLLLALMIFSPYVIDSLFIFGLVFILEACLLILQLILFYFRLMGELGLIWRYDIHLYGIMKP